MAICNLAWLAATDDNVAGFRNSRVYLLLNYWTEAVAVDILQDQIQLVAKVAILADVYLNSIAVGDSVHISDHSMGGFHPNMIVGAVAYLFLGSENRIE